MDARALPVIDIASGRTLVGWRTTHIYTHVPSNSINLRPAHRRPAGIRLHIAFRSATLTETERQNGGNGVR